MLPHLARLPLPARHPLLRCRIHYTSTAACGWGSEFRNKYNVELFYVYKAELKDAKAKGGNGWEVLHRKNRFVRHVAAVICRENSHMLMLSNRPMLFACRMRRRCGSHVVARGRSSSSSAEGE
jgi:hypothetical protein